MTAPERPDLRERSEALFEAWGHRVCRHARPAALAMLLLTAVLASAVPTLRVDNSTDAFLHEHDPARVAYEAFRQRFGRDERITLAIESEDPFGDAFLTRLASLHRELEREVPHLAEVTSLVNARNTRGEGDVLVVEDLLEEWPETPAQREAVRTRAKANPLFRNTLISDDGRVTTVSLELVAYAGDADGDELGGFGEEKDDEPAQLLAEREISAAVRVAQETAARYDAPDFRIRVAGAPVMTQQLNQRMQDDMLRFTALSVLAIGTLLFLLFRRLAAVLLPLAVVVLAMLGTLGAMAWAGGTLTIASQILPSFLLAVGVCDAVHLLTIFYQRLRAGDDREQAIAGALGHSGLAILMTSLTTAGGLASFAAGELRPVADLGVYAPLGVMLAFVYSVVLLPALLALTPLRPVEARRARGDEAVTRVLRALGDFSATHPWTIVASTAAIVVSTCLGLALLRFSHDPMDWFPPGDAMAEATHFMNERLDGVNVVELLVDTGRDGGVTEPAVLEALDALRREAARVHRGPWHIAQSFSIADVVKEIHQALNENRPAFYRIPDSRELVAQELLLFEQSGSDDLEDVVDPLYRTARVTLRVPWLDAMRYPPLLDDLVERLGGVLGDLATLEVTGLVPVLARTFLAMLESMARSYALAIVVIAPLMILLIGSFLRGALCMIPNLAPIALALGTMGWLGWPVDGLTMMIGAIVLGLSVDDTIHFMHNFRRYHESTGDPRAAVWLTLDTTGRALLVTSLVLAAGFLVYAGAYMTNVVHFGVLAAGTILAAFVVNVMLGSALMVLASRASGAPADGR